MHEPRPRYGSAVGSCPASYEQVQEGIAIGESERRRLAERDTVVRQGGHRGILRVSGGDARDRPTTKVAGRQIEASGTAALIRRKVIHNTSKLNVSRSSMGEVPRRSKPIQVLVMLGKAAIERIRCEFQDSRRTRTVDVAG